MRYYLLGGSGALLAAAMMSPGWLAPDPARALPSYARQTGEDCASCHVGGFGPQLTPHGREFKINGFSDGTTKIPFSGMAVANFTHTAKDRADAISGHDGRNDNVALQEASVFLAGRLGKGLGTFIQTTYSEVDRATALDHAEVRYAHPVKIAETDAVVGVDINNNPTLSDPFNSVGAWSFPYTSSDLGFESAAAPLLQGGVEHQALGATAFISLDNGLYAEVGGYRSLKPSLLGSLGIGADAGSISGVAPYWRIAYARDFGRSNASIGLTGMSARLNPDRDGGPTDRYSDIGVDATYQFLGNRQNIVSFNASYIHEDQTLNHAVFTGATSLAKHNLETISGDVSWYYKKHFGLTLGGFSTAGTRDTELFAPADEEGSRVGKPDTTGYVVQADYSPWGGEGQSTFANLRFGLQYKGYTKFNGANQDYDGSGRAASDNNTLTAFLWTAF